MADDAIFDMDMDELFELQVDSVATATPTLSRKRPASTTTITQQMIRDSSARSLFELLEIYVPNFHYMRHHWEAMHMGLRGIMSDRDDKYLLLVNGRLMNEKTHFGALSERDLPMMGDIRQINVVRGPGSVVYGPGAVAMVIDIKTDNYLTNDEDEVIFKVGGVEEFQSLELKKSITLGAKEGFYFYAGISDYQGADNDDAPLVYGNSDTTTWGDPIESGQPSNIGHPNDHEAYRGIPKVKLHANYTNNNFDAWFRYTKGGEKLTWSHKVLAPQPDGFRGNDPETRDPCVFLSGAELASCRQANPDVEPYDPERIVGIDDSAEQGVGYQQWSMALDYKQIFDQHLWWDYRLSFDRFDYERIQFSNQNYTNNPPESYQEDELQLKALMNYQPNESHAIAFGLEYSNERFGRKSPGFPNSNPRSFTLGKAMPKWNSQTYSLLLEEQWQMNDWLTHFIGMRIDKDEYTRRMYSPRLATVATPDDKNTYKLIWSRSVRKNFAEELFQRERQNGTSNPEKLESLELIYERQANQSTFLAASAFYNKLDVIAFDVTSLTDKPVAKQHFGGIELEAIYSTQHWRAAFSHSYTKLDSFEIIEDGAFPLITASAYGWGNDLMNWSDHITKLSGTYKYSDKVSLDASLRVFWKYTGAEDWARYSTYLKEINPNEDQDVDGDGKPDTRPSTAIVDQGYDEPFGESVFLNLGANYKLSDNTKADLHFYNLMGLFDGTYNKRLYLINVANYREEAPAVALTLTHTF